MYEHNQKICSSTKWLHIRKITALSPYLVMQNKKKTIFRKFDGPIISIDT